MTRKLFSAVLIVCLMMMVLAGCGGKNSSKSESNNSSNDDGSEKLKIGMITDAGGLGDQSFNDTAYLGLKKLESEFGAEISVIESTEMTQYVTNLTKLADQDYDMIVAVGALLEDAVIDAAKQRPDSNFLIVDTVAQGDNILSIIYREQEGSFLAGVAAGLTTKVNKVGFIGGMDIPPVERWRVGFEAGVKTVNPDCQVIVSFVEEFGNPNKGKQLALTQYNNGIDVIFAVAGQSGLGVIQAAEEKGEGFYVIGSDSDQNYLAPKNVIASVTKAVDKSIYDAYLLLSEEKFTGKTISQGLSEQAMGLTTTGNMLPLEVINEVLYWNEQIYSGKLEVPSSLDELGGFNPPSKQ